MRRLFAGLNLVMTDEVVLAFGMPQQHFAGLIFYFDRVRCPCRKATKRLPEGLTRRKCSMRGCDFPRAVENTYRCIRHHPRYIDCGFDRHSLCGLALATEVDYGVRICSRNPTEFANRNPVFSEGSGFLRIQKSVSLLISEQASLDLHVRAVVVRQGGTPVQTIFVTAPGPNLLRRKIQRRRIMHDSRISMRMIHGHVRLPAAVTEARHRTILVIADNTLVDAGSIYWPGIDISESMRSREFHGIQDMAVVPDLDTSVRPPIETVTGVATVIERGFLFEAGSARAQRELDTPLHAIGPVDVADPDRSAAVRFAAGGEVDWRDRHPIVRNRKIKLNSQRRPHAAICNARKLDSWIRIKHRCAIDLVSAGVEMASKIGQHAALEVFIFQIERSPLSRDAPVHQTVTQGVGIIEERASVKKIEWWIRVRKSFVRGRNGHRVFPDSHRGC